MNVGALFGRVALWSARRPKLVLALVALLAAAGALGALRLESSADTDTLVDRDSQSFQATEEFKRKFGDEAVVILVNGDLQRLVLTSDLGKLLSLEGCLSGNVPAGIKPAPGPCTEIAEARPTKVVYGPGTFVNEAANQIATQFGAQQKTQMARAEQAAREARKRAAKSGASPAKQRAEGKRAREEVLGQFTQQVLGAALRYGITSQPALNNTDFVSRLVFDARGGAGQPKPRFAYIFPSGKSALISIRMRSGLSAAERERAIDLYRAAAERKEYQLEHGSYVVTGVPVVVDSLASTVSKAILILLVGSLIVMALTLALVFRSPLRLLPLGMALAAGGITFGALSLVGGTLTMASIAVLPVLIGLGVDYAIQFQARFNEARESGLEVEPAIQSAASRGGPIIATAGLATAAGFLALMLSPVPMVRAFGLMLIVGIALAFILAVTAGFAAVALLNSPGSARGIPVFGSIRRRISARRSKRRAAAGPGLQRRGIATLRAWRHRALNPFRALGRTIARVGAGVLNRVQDLQSRAFARLRSASQTALAVGIAQPGRVLVIATVLAATGWVAGARTELVSDVRDLVPPNLQALKDVNKLQEATGVSGEIDVSVTAPDLTDPKTITWMSTFQKRVLERHGFSGENASCERADLCPAVALPDLFRADTSQITKESVTTLLDAVPPYFSQAVITRDRRTATIAFGIRVMPLDRQQRLIDDIKAQLDPPGTALDPPAGVEASVAGLPVLAAEANSALSASRYWLTLVGLVAVFAVLLGVYRSRRRALVPLIPIVLATGWSALVLAASEIPLNPMSATLGALVVAIATEFSVILSARYREERAGGNSVGEALRRTYARTGTAVAASGATAIAGFGVLMATNIRMLREFGFVTVVDLSVALVGVLLVLPAVLVWAERWEGERAPEPVATPSEPRREAPVGSPA